MKEATLGVIWISLFLLTPCPLVAAEDEYNQSLTAFLHDNFDKHNAGMVVALVDEHGTKMFSAGKLDNGTDRRVDGDTVFEIGSVTKTFTSLLLLEMAEQGEVKADDPVVRYLPDSVKVPSRNGKEITLLHLAAQESGLPFNANNHTGEDWRERFATYTVPKMYEYLSGHTLAQEPGEKFVYSNIGMGLLGHALSLRAGKDFETLVVERVCRPLNMGDTRVTLTPDQKARLARGHDEAGKPAANYERPAVAGAGALRSTANDLAKYVSAQVGLTPSALTPLMERTHATRHNAGRIGNDVIDVQTAMPWVDGGVYHPPGSRLLGHGGGTEGYNSFVGFDLKKRRGVVVLTSQRAIQSSALGWRILQRARLAGLDAKRMGPMREIVGIGTALGIDETSGTVQITAAVPNSPAAQAGLTAGLVVRSIDGV